MLQKILTIQDDSDVFSTFDAEVVPVVEEDDEADTALADWDGNPFVKHGKLYGQDYHRIRVSTDYC